MNHNKSVCPTRIPESPIIVSESISANKVQLVIAILKEFISEVVRGSMTSKKYVWKGTCESKER